MATSGSVSAFEVGSYFISQYYRVLKESPDYAHQFYNDSSTLTRVDSNDSLTASTLMEIHSLHTSLNISGVEVTRLNCQESLNGGILVVVSGVVRSMNFAGKRNFSQVFFLAPQEKGYFILNDVLQIDDEVLANQHSVPEIPEIRVDSEVHLSNSHEDQPVSNELDEETWEYVNSIHIEDNNPVDKYSLPDEPHHEEDPEPETVVEEAPSLEEPPQAEIPVHHVDHVDNSGSEPANEPAKMSYASILRAAKAQAGQPVSSQPTVRQSIQPPSEPPQRVETIPPQLNASASMYVSKTGGAWADESSAQEEGELTSVYVRGLPSNVTSADLEKEFKKFGKIKPNGVFIRNKEIGVCFAFVEFEDMSGVHNAVKAASVEVLGRQVYIEERRANSNSSIRGGGAARGRGRARGSYQSEAPRGRGGIRNSVRASGADGLDYNRIRGNGYQQRA